ncbi:MAG TPA: hypothetical protein VEJ63_19810 [Planctomycetota bacterium]|nr:hypothetical protein [Planctomycetota bacterium]
MRAVLCASILTTLTLTVAAFEDITPEQTKSADRGIEWLIKAQNKDGSWGMDLKTTPNVAATAVAGLALLSSGNTDRDGPSKETVKALKSCVQYLLERGKKTRPGHDIAEGERSEVQTYVGAYAPTFYSVVFLSQIYGNRSLDLPSDTYSEIKEVLTKLSDTISKSQETDGSWHKETYSSLQATCLAWMALRSANSTGIQIRHATVDKTLRFIRSQYNSGTRLFDGARANNNVVYASASAIRVIYGMGLWNEREGKDSGRAFINMVAKGPMAQQFLTNVGEDYPAAVFVTHALIKQGGDNWETWFNYVRTKLLKFQNADGSWTATSCLQGRTFATACSVLCLQTPYRLLPLQDL